MTVPGNSERNERIGKKCVVWKGDFLNYRERELLIGLTALYEQPEESELEEIHKRDRKNISHFKSIKDNIGRSNTLDNLFETYKEEKAKYSNLGEETVKMIIERFELIDLIKNGKVKLATIRGGSLLHSIVKDKISNPEEKFLCDTEKARSSENINKKEKKSLDFIWKIRCDIAHNYWIDTEHDHRHYSIAANMILVHLYIEIESRLEDKEIKEKVLPSSIDQTNLESPKEGLNAFLEIIETDLGHKYSKNESWNI